MNNNHIIGVKDPTADKHAANKEYVDMQDSKQDTAINLNLSGGNMAGNINLVNSHKIINSADPTSNTDLVTKKYMESHVRKSHITSSHKSNVFSYIMSNPSAELTEEEDIELGDIVIIDSSPHQINKNMIDAKLVLDSNKGYYSSRLGINLHSLANGDYTMAFEIHWTDSNIDRYTVSLDGVSSIETIHSMEKKVDFEYAKAIVQFNKSQNIRNNYLYMDITMKMKSGAAYPQKLQTYILCYGVKGFQMDVPSIVYDALWTIDNGKIVMNETIDMGNKTIIGIKDGTVNTGAVNFGQMTSLFLALDTSLKKLINANKALIDKKKWLPRPCQHVQ